MPLYRFAVLVSAILAAFPSAPWQQQTSAITARLRGVSSVTAKIPMNVSSWISAGTFGYDALSFPKGFLVGWRLGAGGRIRTWRSQ